MAYLYPYGDTQQLNLDWLIEQWNEVKSQIDGSLQAEIDRVEAAITDLLTARDEAVAAQTAAQLSAQAAAGSASTASGAASTAQAQAQAAAGSAATAGAHASDAQQYMLTADQYAQAAQNSAGAANASASQAAGSTQDAQTYAQQASGSAQNAAGSATAAQQQFQLADAARQAAQGAASDAADSAQDAQDVLDSIPEDYTDLSNDVSELKTAFSADNSIIFEIGTINAGIPTVSDKYVRNVDFVHANKNDAIIITPTEFTINGAIYLYSKPQTESYISGTTIATIQIGNTYTYTFTNECYFKMRAQKGGAPVLSSTDVQKFESAIKHFHNYSYSDFELSKNDALALPIDYATITAAMNGKVNFVLQTDLHMSAFYRYNDTTKWNPSDFYTFESVVKTMAKLNADGLIDLGDTVAGYGFDPDYETRKSLDKIIKTYRDYYPSEEKFFLIGNHDDGNAFYYNTTYNDKQSVEDVIYPSEQFNRIVKHGNNNGYVQNYYYKDVNGVRIIVLYQRDFDYSTDIPQIEEFEIGSDQINWLTNTALDTNLPVLVLTHASLAPSIYTISRTGFDSVLNALDNFVQNGGNVIAVFSGHKHAEANATVNGINHIVFSNGYTFFYLISIDIANRTITCTPINNTALNVRTFNF